MGVHNYHCAVHILKGLKKNFQWYVYEKAERFFHPSRLSEYFIFTLKAPFFNSFLFLLGEAWPCDGPEVPDQRGPPQLEQSLHQDQGAADGEGHRVLLRQSLPRAHAQEQVRRVRVHIQERGFLVSGSEMAFRKNVQATCFYSVYTTGSCYTWIFW